MCPRENEDFDAHLAQQCEKAISDFGINTTLSDRFIASLITIRPVQILSVMPDALFLRYADDSFRLLGKVTVLSTQGPKYLEVDLVLGGKKVTDEPPLSNSEALTIFYRQLFLIHNSINHN